MSTMAKPKILVVGATGFIGAHVCRELAARGYPVRAVRRSNSPTFHLDDLDVEWATADLDVAATLAGVVDGCAGVIHAAGFYPTHALDTDRGLRRGVGQMRHLFDACLRARVARVVYVSSPATLGAPDDADRVVDETDFYVPGTLDNAYFETKWAMESEVYRYVRGGLGVVIAIPSAVFGPGDVKPTTGRYVLAAAAGKLPATVGGPMDAVDVRDVADSLVTAMERGRPGRRYALGGERTTVAEFTALVCELAGVAPPRFRVPARGARLVARGLERVGRSVGLPVPPLLVGVDLATTARHLNSERARAELDHHSRPLGDTLADTLAWFERHDYR